MGDRASGIKEQSDFLRVREFGAAEFLTGAYRKLQYSRHAHGRYCLGVVAHGVMEIARPTGVFRAPQGALFMLNHDEVHWGGKADDNGWRMKTLYLDPVAARDVIEEAMPGARGTVFFQNPVVEKTAMSREFLAMHDAFTGEGSRLEQETRLITFLHRLFNRYGSEAFCLPSRGTEPAAVKRAREYLDAHACDPVSLDELATLCGLSAFRVTRVFSRTVGMPPHAYQMHLRVHHAQGLLRKGWALAETAAFCGFSDQSHMTRIFQRFLGITPGRFRTAQ